MLAASTATTSARMIHRLLLPVPMIPSLAGSRSGRLYPKPEPG
jgi:hypothetical protein